MFQGNGSDRFVGMFDQFQQLTSEGGTVLAPGVVDRGIPSAFKGELIAFA
jgi:hypothetical protein